MGRGRPARSELGVSKMQPVSVVRDASLALPGGRGSEAMVTKMS